MSIQEQLRLLSEGNVALNDDDDDVEFDKELVESWFINSNKFLSESVNNESLIDLVVEMTTLLEAGTATPDETLTVMAKIKAKMQKYKTKFDPYEGLRDLKLIQERMLAMGTIQKHSILPIIGPFIGLLKYARHVKGLEKKDIQAFITEAEKMRGILHNKLQKAISQKDDKSVEYLQRVLKKLDAQINAFKLDMNQLGKHGV